MIYKRNEVQRVLLITLFLNLFVAALKIAFGLATGALAIIADGVHSITDGAGNVAGLIGNYYAHRPADENHPYGHQRIETLAALIIGTLLSLTAWEVLKSVIDRLQNPILPNLTVETLVILLATLGINLFVSRYQMRAGHRLGSKILQADAQNTGADVYVTISVIISSVIVMLTGWLWVDIAVALVVMVLIGRAAWHIIHETGSVLTDSAPYQALHLKALVEQVDGVEHVIRARSRGADDATHIDIDVRVAPQTTTTRTDQMATTIDQHLRAHLSGIAEVEVHFSTEGEALDDPMWIAHTQAEALGFTAHEVQLSELDGNTMLELHVEVPPTLSISDAHEQVSLLEEQLREQLAVDQVITHIEPAQTILPTPATNGWRAEADWLEAEALRLLNKEYPTIHWHDLTVRFLQEGYALALHAEVPANLTVEGAHRIAENAEIFLKANLNLLNRITIHTEPYDHL